MSQPSPSSSSGPWSLAAGLFAACVTTIIGIISGCAPETVLYRCLVAGGVVTMVAMLVRSLWKLADTEGY